MSDWLAMKIAQLMAEAEWEGLSSEAVEAAYEDAHGMWVHGAHPDPEIGQEPGT